MPPYDEPVGLVPSAQSRLPPAVRQAIDRVEAEYREMPGLTLTVSQVQRLCGLDRAACTIALATLLQRRFLKRAANGAYVRTQSR